MRHEILRGRKITDIGVEWQEEGDCPARRVSMGFALVSGEYRASSGHDASCG